MVLDISWLNTQQYKVRIKGKVEPSMERSNALPYSSVLKLLKSELSGHPRLKGDNFALDGSSLLYICYLEVFSSSILSYILSWRCPWCNGYSRRIWTLRHEFKSWTWLIAFHIALIPLGKVGIQLFSLQLWVNSRADWVLQLWWGEGKLWIQIC